jgi:hypothetical protein
VIIVGDAVNTSVLGGLEGLSGNWGKNPYHPKVKDAD